MIQRELSHIWDLEKKEIVATHQLSTKEPIAQVTWRTHDKIAALTPQHRYQFDLRDLLVGLFLEKALRQAKDQSQHQPPHRIRNLHSKKKLPFDNKKSIVYS